MTPEQVILLSGGFTLVSSTLAWFLARRDRREERLHNSASPGAPTVQEIWIRQDKMEKAFRAALVLLGQVAEQWPAEDAPRLSQNAVQVLRENEYLPEEIDHLLRRQGDNNVAKSD